MNSLCKNTNSLHRHSRIHHSCFYHKTLTKINKTKSFKITKLIRWLAARVASEFNVLCRPITTDLEK
jgi:hypothetical protein